MTHKGQIQALRPGEAYQAARLRSASLQDASRLARLYESARPESSETEKDLRNWLERGGALYLENPGGEILSAVRWAEREGGWTVDRIATLPSERGQAFGRWLMTKVEALAIRHNVPELSLTLERDDLLPYYQRLGYRLTDRSEERSTLKKRVGGTWQYQLESTS
ncbi:MAG: GNAT family N-acetyltransferase [Truepera sp.]|nr:GNAT family N-acetyltransferase [Truepera sp.]